MSYDEELNKIKGAFDRVKADNIYLSNRLDQLEKSNNELVAYVMKMKSNVVANTSAVSKDSEEIFIGNKSSMKVHVTNCPYAKRVNGDNRVIFDTINDAIREKYIRCSCISQ